MQTLGHQRCPFHFSSLPRAMKPKAQPQPDGEHTQNKTKAGCYPVPYPKINFTQTEDLNVSGPKPQRYKIKLLHDKKQIEKHQDERNDKFRENILQ